MMIRKDGKRMYEKICSLWLVWRSSVRMTPLALLLLPPPWVCRPSEQREGAI